MPNTRKSSDTFAADKRSETPPASNKSLLDPRSERLEHLAKFVAQGSQPGLLSHRYRHRLNLFGKRTQDNVT